MTVKNKRILILTDDTHNKHLNFFHVKNLLHKQTIRKNLSSQKKSLKVIDVPPPQTTPQQTPYLSSCHGSSPFKEILPDPAGLSGIARGPECSINLMAPEVSSSSKRRNKFRHECPSHVKEEEKEEKKLDVITIIEEPGYTWKLGAPVFKNVCPRIWDRKTVVVLL